jgi:hypothetical protein
MATIEIYESAVTTKQVLYCIYCDGQVTNQTHCVPCNEYKSVVTLAQYVEFNGHYPRIQAVK